MKQSQNGPAQRQPSNQVINYQMRPQQFPNGGFQSQASLQNRLPSSHLQNSITSYQTQQKFQVIPQYQPIQTSLSNNHSNQQFMVIPQEHIIQTSQSNYQTNQKFIGHPEDNQKSIDISNLNMMSNDKLQKRRTTQEFMISQKIVNDNNYQTRQDMQNNQYMSVSEQAMVKQSTAEKKRMLLLPKNLDKELYTKDDFDEILKTLSRYYVQDMVSSKMEKSQNLSNKKESQGFNKKKVRDSLALNHKKFHKFRQSIKNLNQKSLETNQITEQIEEFDNYFEDILHLLDESDNTGQTINLDLNGNSTLDFNPSASKQIEILEKEIKKLMDTNAYLQNTENDREDLTKAYQQDINDMIAEITVYKNKNALQAAEIQDLTHENTLLKNKTEILKEEAAKKIPQDQQKIHKELQDLKDQMTIKDKLIEDLNNQINDSQTKFSNLNDQNSLTKLQLGQLQIETLKLKESYNKVLNELRGNQSISHSNKDKILETRISEQNEIILAQKEQTLDLIKEVDSIKDKINQKYKHQLIDQEIQKISDTLQNKMNQDAQISKLNRENCNLLAERTDILDYLQMMNRQNLISIQDFEIIENQINENLRPDEQQKDSQRKSLRNLVDENKDSNENNQPEQNQQLILNKDTQVQERKESDDIDKLNQDQSQNSQQQNFTNQNKKNKRKHKKSK